MKNETYKVLKNRHQIEINAFPLGAAFNEKQFADMMHNWGLKTNETKKILSLGAGMYIRKDDLSSFMQMQSRHKKEINDAIKSDETGDKFIYQMFYYELCNHEFGYTGDLSDTLNALGFTAEEINSKPSLLHGLNKAVNKIYDEDF